ncbi:hypothetical protein C7E12_16160 [Stenotrophomonas maltophilia]|nr:hypothetical protein C7E12_16160 [Stenotrophomonas maltophilia]
MEWVERVPASKRLRSAVVAFDVESAFKRAEHRRSGEGEEARVSERSEFPRRPSTGRGAQGAGA